jgi:hypothetical protein
MRTCLIALSVIGLGSTAFAQTPAVEASGSVSQPNAFVVGVRANGAKITGDAADFFNMGIGFGAAAGYELHMANLAITPELAVNYTRFGVNDMLSQNGDAMWVLGVLPGARVGYNVGMVTPWLALHFGLDHGGGGNSSTDKLGMDVGAGADFALGSARLGPFFAYNIDFTDGTSVNWLSFGVGGSLGL